MTATISGSPGPTEANNSGESTGMVIGIAVGAVAIGVVATVVICLLLRRKRQREMVFQGFSTQLSSQLEPEMRNQW
jgi:hypothetical protein